MRPSVRAQRSASLRTPGRRAPQHHQQQPLLSQPLSRCLLTPGPDSNCTPPYSPRRRFHDYFVTHLPSSSLHPDSRTQVASHKLPRDDSTPHDAKDGRDARSPASFAPHSRSGPPSASREMTVVRIPLKSAKHHYGAACGRGTRPYNEDAHQAGTVELPAFAKRGPISLTGRRRGAGSGQEEEPQGADSASGDPQGLANTRAFGDVRSKRVGVSAEPELRLLHLAPAAHAFLVLVSDGVTVALADQEIVDVVKEARTPEQGARDVVELATELAEGEKGQADNATAVVVRLGGWERRNEGGVGSLGTKEARDWRRKEAMSGRGRRT
ncbi:hypothetical protein FH972_025114 [Carpinus fangiana]|uniref:PPM-type phosphatase domain-containing protein n=1 Tax=Carpinus fangiana TaxID=176857 RepID=A0A5N6L0B2_9ROSI|nr:hypothetical protein FH972_025114 [Carpinus fangiana]